MIEIDPNLAGEIEQERERERLDKEKKDWIKILERSGIERRYRYCTFANIEAQVVPPQVEDEHRRVKYYADHIVEHVDAGMGLALLGPVGTLKTSLAVAVLQEGLKAGISGMFITMPSLLDTIFTLKNISREEWARFEERLRTVGILLLDDLGAEHSEGWVHTKIDAIVSERYNRMKPVLITSNMTTDELAKTYNARIFDRIRSTSEVIKFAGKSLRKARSA
jgi:DNA replication protein DnaC